VDDRTTMENVRIPGYVGLQRVVVTDDRVVAVESIGLTTPDAPEVWLSLGGVDLQINGALGLAFPDLTAAHGAQLETIGQFLWAAGVDGYCPTIVTTSIANIQRSLSVIHTFKPQSPQTATILGVHLEGPCLNQAKRGAHPAEFLQPLTIDVMQAILGNCTDIVKIITLAPELDPSGSVVEYLHHLGITVSLGHSQATAAEATQAFNQGATMVTHAFNAMPPLHHREPGMLGAAIVDPRVMCGFIADGEHICPTMLKLLIQASGGSQGLFLVSDALSPLGLPDGRYPWDSRSITVTNGTARLDDGTLSGTTLSLLQGAKNLVEWGLCSIEEAITLATIAPRRAIGQSIDLVGQPLDRLLVWSVDRQQIQGWRRLT
jgi:N-acetylglucosamine-6-phosphate deacetylase